MIEQLEARKANYQSLIDKHVKTIQQCQTTANQLAMSVEQLRGAIIVCDELIKEQADVPSSSTPEQESS